MTDHLEAAQRTSRAIQQQGALAWTALRWGGYAKLLFHPLADVRLFARRRPYAGDHCCARFAPCRIARPVGDRGLLRDTPHRAARDARRQGGVESMT